MNFHKFLFVMVAFVGLISAQPANGPVTEPPGRGVLCLGTFVYFADRYARECRAGDDSEFQARLAMYVSRFDAYIIRNTPNGAADLDAFKRDEGVIGGSRGAICEHEFLAKLYENMRDQPPEGLDSQIDSLLARDGTPSFGDCV